LDDAFFSIDAFNRETEALEAQSRSSGALNDDDDEEEEDVDLFMAVEDIEDKEGEVNGKQHYQYLLVLDLTSLDPTETDPQYKDFFAPPPKPKKSAKPKPQSPTKPKRKLRLLVASPPKRLTKVRFNEEVRVRNIKSKRTRASLLAELAEAEAEDEDGDGDERDWVDEDEGAVWTSEMMDGSEEEESSGSGDSEDEDGVQGAMGDDLFAEDESMDDGEGKFAHAAIFYTVSRLSGYLV
jgi:U3 small nucleolar RNA-associated protein MPP10